MWKVKIITVIYITQLRQSHLRANVKMTSNPRESFWHWPRHLNIQADIQQLLFLLLMLYSIGFQISGHWGQICQKPVITTQKAKSERTSIAWSNYRDTSNYICANYLSRAQRNRRRHHYDLQINFSALPQNYFLCHYPTSEAERFPGSQRWSSISPFVGRKWATLYSSETASRRKSVMCFQPSSDAEVGKWPAVADKCVTGWRKGSPRSCQNHTLPPAAF